jgi:hypothetical protein
MNCSRLCILCEKPKKTFINLSKFHGICEDENVDSQKFLNCKHCFSIVPIISIRLETQDESFELIQGKSINLLPKSFVPIPIDMDFYKFHGIKGEVIKSNIAHIPPEKANSGLIDIMNYPVLSNSMPHSRTNNDFKEFPDDFEDNEDSRFRNSSENIDASNSKLSKVIEKSRPDSDISANLNPGFSVPNSEKLKAFLSRYYCTILLVLTILSFIASFLIIYFIQ